MGIWYISLGMTRTHLSYSQTIVADVLIKQGASSSATMVVTYVAWNVPVPEPEGLIWPN